MHRSKIDMNAFNVILGLQNNDNKYTIHYRNLLSKGISILRKSRASLCNMEIQIVWFHRKAICKQVVSCYSI